MATPSVVPAADLACRASPFRASAAARPREGDARARSGVPSRSTAAERLQRLTRALAAAQACAVAGDVERRGSRLLAPHPGEGLPPSSIEEARREAVGPEVRDLRENGRSPSLPDVRPRRLLRVERRARHGTLQAIGPPSDPAAWVPLRLPLVFRVQRVSRLTPIRAHGIPPAAESGSRASRGRRRVGVHALSPGGPASSGRATGPWPSAVAASAPCSTACPRTVRRSSSWTWTVEPLCSGRITIRPSSTARSSHIPTTGA